MSGRVTDTPKIEKKRRAGGRAAWSSRIYFYSVNGITTTIFLKAELNSDELRGRRIQATTVSAD